MTRLAAINWRSRAWTIYLAVGGILTAGYLWFPPLKASGPLINVLGLSSSVAIAVGIYLHRPKARVAWVLFIVGNFLFFAGDLYTYSYPKLMGVDVEFPSIGDGTSSIFDQTGRLLEGELPSPIDLPRGCRFAGRCPHRMARCREEEPRLQAAAPGHLVACHLYGEGESHKGEPA